MRKLALSILIITTGAAAVFLQNLYWESALDNPGVDVTGDDGWAEDFLFSSEGKYAMLIVASFCFAILMGAFRAREPRGSPVTDLQTKGSPLALTNAEGPSSALHADEHHSAATNSNEDEPALDESVMTWLKEGEPVEGPNIRGEATSRVTDQTSLQEPPFQEILREFLVCGVDRETQKDVRLRIAAESDANARKKAELHGMCVTEVEQMRGGSIVSRKGAQRKVNRKKGGTSRYRIVFGVLLFSTALVAGYFIGRGTARDAPKYRFLNHGNLLWRIDVSTGETWAAYGRIGRSEWRRIPESSLPSSESWSEDRPEADR